MKYLVLVVIPALALAGLILFITVIFPRVFGTVYASSPQPVDFDHRIHVQVAGLECSFCHRLAEVATTAGYPDVQQCMFCHSVVGIGNDEIEKVRRAWANQTAIDWVRVHRMPDHVGFVHEAHIQRGFPCSTCHGDVGSMGIAKQVRPLNMGDCVDCHRQNGAPTECATCHR